MPHSDADQELLDLQRAMSAQGTVVAGMPSGAAVAADPETVRAWEARRAAQREAYGQYVAAGDIWIGNALAFTAGMAVPLEHVINYDLLEREQVHRIATPEMARVGKAFETDEEFLAANPHVSRQLKARMARGDMSPAALDPRGGGAAKDDAKKAGEDTGGTVAGDDSEERREVVAADLVEKREAAEDAEAEKPTPAKRRSGGTGSGSAKSDTNTKES